MNMLVNIFCGLVVFFVVTGVRSWSFTLNLEVLQEKLFVLISITLCADSVATSASLDQILCFTNM